MLLFRLFFLHFQTPLHRQRHPQEDDPVSGWPLLKDTEDQNPSHGWTRSRVPSQWNDQGSTSSAVREFFCYHRDWKSWMRSAVDRHHGCLHNNITWHAYIMWSQMETESTSLQLWWCIYCQLEKDCRLHCSSLCSISLKWLLKHINTHLSLCILNTNTKITPTPSWWFLSYHNYSSTATRVSAFLQVYASLTFPQNVDFRCNLSIPHGSFPLLCLYFTGFRSFPNRLFQYQQLKSGCFTFKKKHDIC